MNSLSIGPHPPSNRVRPHGSPLATQASQLTTQFSTSTCSSYIITSQFTKMYKFLATLLFFLTIAGGLAIHGFSIRNGMSDMIEDARVHNLLADGTRNPYMGKIIGIGGIDFMLLTLVNLFWPVSQGETPGLCLLGVLFGGQLVAFLTVVMIEGFREGNKGRLVCL